MTKRSLSALGAAALAVAAGLFFITISPPVTEAAADDGVEPAQVAVTAPADLPSFDDSYQRHMGVLDTLKTRKAR